MVKLRLRRRGRKRLPIYDIVAADSRSPRDGRIIERIGQYNPTITSGATMLDRDRAAYWVRTGAQPTDTVRDILSREGILLAIQMEHKGASAEEITTAVETHKLKVKSREAQKNGAAKKETKEEAPAAEETATEEAATEEAATEAPAEETATEDAPAAEEATTEEAAAEAPAEETAAAETEEAPAAEETATEEAAEAPAEETAAAETEEAPAAEETATEEAPAEEEKSAE